MHKGPPQPHLPLFRKIQGEVANTCTYYWTRSSGLSGFARFTFRNYKQILLELERLYDLVIDVEDCEKKLMALPTNTAMRTQVEREKEQAVARLGPALAVESRYIKRRTSSNYPLFYKEGVY